MPRKNGNVTRGERRQSQRNKQQKTERVLDPRFNEEREKLIKPVLAKNAHQKEYLRSIMSNMITVGRGSAGTGKTWCAAAMASNMYLKGEIDKIVVMRPLVGMGKSSGFWPGTIQDKLGPYLAPILSTIRERIGDARYENDFNKNIVIQPMEAVRGMNFNEKTFIIIDEAQNCTPEEIRSLTTRLAEGSRAVFCGDSKQKDLQGMSGIDYLCNLISKHSIENCGFVDFTPEDIVRSGLTRVFVELYDAEGPCPK
jgi:phosphate starvation-inducible PhoH-like protein